VIDIGRYLKIVGLKEEKEEASLIKILFGKGALISSIS
jgi:hypothetical protein